MEKKVPSLGTYFGDVLDEKFALSLDHLASKACTPLSEPWQDKMQQLIYNLEINQKYLLSKYTPEQLIQLNNASLIDNITDAETKQHQQTMEVYHRLLKKRFGDKGSKTILCRRCGEKGNVEWVPKQTRSADEGSTIFCVCRNCKTRWRM